MACDNCSCGIAAGLESQRPNILYGRQLCDWCYALLKRRGYLKPPVHSAHGECRQTYWYVEDGNWRVERTEHEKLVV